MQRRAIGCMFLVLILLQVAVIHASSMFILHQSHRINHFTLLETDREKDISRMHSVCTQQFNIRMEHEDDENE